MIQIFKSIKNTVTNIPDFISVFFLFNLILSIINYLLVICKINILDIDGTIKYEFYFMYP